MLCPGRRYSLKDNVITGLGVGSGTAASFVPIAAMVIVTLFGVLGFQQAKLRTDCYSEREMRRATEYWAVHLLVLRDLDMHRNRNNQDRYPHLAAFFQVQPS